MTDPHDQGVVAMVGVFIDTFVVLTLNALVIISTLYTADGPLAGGYVGGVTEVLDKTNLAQTAFGTVMGAGWAPSSWPSACFSSPSPPCWGGTCLVRST